MRNFMLVELARIFDEPTAAVEEPTRARLEAPEYVCVDRSWLCVFLSERRKSKIMLVLNVNVFACMRTCPRDLCFSLSSFPFCCVTLG